MQTGFVGLHLFAGWFVLRVVGAGLWWHPRLAYADILPKNGMVLERGRGWGAYFVQGDENGRVDCKHLPMAEA